MRIELDPSLCGNCPNIVVAGEWSKACEKVEEFARSEDSLTLKEEGSMICRRGLYRYNGWHCGVGRPQPPQIEHQPLAIGDIQLTLDVKVPLPKFQGRLQSDGGFYLGSVEPSKV